MAFVSKCWSFEAAHHLPDHFGKCKHPHGHSYRFEVVVEGVINNPYLGLTDSGMVVDFYTLDSAVRPLIEQYLDHRDLNQTLGPEIGVTTAEMIGVWIFDKVRRKVEGVKCVVVWETATSCARIFEEDVDVWMARRSSS